MVIPEPEKILKKRREIETEMLKHFAVTVEDLAEYFNCPPKTIRKDMESVEPAEFKKKPVNITVLREKRDRELFSRIENGEKQEDVLYEYGLWRLPKDFRSPGIAKELSEAAEAMPCDPEKKARCLALFEIGFTAADIYPRVGGLDATSRRIFEQQLKEKGFTNRNYLHYDKDFLETVSEAAKAIDENAMKNGMTVRSELVEFRKLWELTGAYKQDVLNAVGKKGNDDYKTDKDKDRIIERKKRNEDKQKLKEEVYHRWSSGQATQKELAEEYGVTIASIRNYISEVKARNLSSMMKELPTVRRRNSNIEVRKRVAEKKERFLSFYFGLSEEERGNMSISKMGQLTGMKDGDVRKFLLQENLIPVKYEHSSLYDIEEASLYSEASYRKGVMSLFGYGPNAGRTKDADSDQIIRHQRETQYGLNNSPELRESFNENKGSITRHFVRRNERARKEYIKKYPEKAVELQMEMEEIER